VLPGLFVGVWVRESISLDDGRASGEEEVVWLQGPETFADVRLLPDAGPCGQVTEAFGGTTHWNGSALHWEHELDWHGGFADTDLGRIEWVDDVMVERGTLAVTGADGDRREVTYEEIWRREELGDAAEVLAATSPGHRGLHVAVGDWTITLAARGPGTFAVRLVRPGRTTVEVGEGGLCVPALDDPEWGWTPRDLPEENPGSRVGPAVETLSKHPLRRVLP
jgi:hypothetical protein